MTNALAQLKASLLITSMGQITQHMIYMFHSCAYHKNVPKHLTLPCDRNPNLIPLLRRELASSSQVWQTLSTLSTEQQMHIQHCLQKDDLLSLQAQEHLCQKGLKFCRRKLTYSNPNNHSETISQRYIPSSLLKQYSNFILLNRCNTSMKTIFNVFKIFLS